MEGRHPEASSHFETALTLRKKRIKKRNYFHTGQTGIFHLLALLLQGTPQSIKKAKTYLKQDDTPLNQLMFPFLLFQQNEDSKAKLLLREIKPNSYPEYNLFVILVKYWINNTISNAEADILKRDLMNIDRKAAPLPWFEIQHLLAGVQKPSVANQQYMQQLQDEKNWIPLAQRFQKEEGWIRALSALESGFFASDKKAVAAPADQRIIWLFDIRNNNLRPIEQRLGKTGKWTKGRRMALKRLRTETLPDCAIPEDIPLIGAITQHFNYNGWGNSEEWEIDTKKILKNLVDHPNIFLEKSPTTRCNFILEKPTLTVDKKKDGLLMRIDPEITQDGVRIEEITPARFRILEVSKAIMNVHRALGGNTLKLPLSGQERLSKILNAMAEKVDIQSDVVGSDTSLEEVKSKGLPCVHLLPVSDGFSVQLFVKPIKSEPIFLKLGEGKDTIFASVKNKKVIIRRNLTTEGKNKKALFKHCSVLNDYNDGTDIWELNELTLCLDLLLQLKEYGNKVIVEWPKGEKLKIRSLIGPDNVFLNIKKERDWFNINGEVKINDITLMKLQELLKLNSQQSTGNFIELGNGEFMALSAELKKKLDEMSRFTSTDKQQIRLNPLTSLLFQDLDLLLTNTTTDKAWDKHKKKIATAYSTVAKVPGTLQADLRSYQVKGYQWLSCLYDMEAGACLADDMGLGKTIQTIALLIAKAKAGPSLIIAPASVVPNWESELARFAPVLHVYDLNGRDRKQNLKNLKPFDVVIGSYGIVMHKVEQMKEMDWNIISLDEAQAIKNSKTKRSAAIMQLPAKFKMVTTGTPMENHLGELWNLFNFINPGLLGDNTSFQRKFIAPIEKEDNIEARQHLQKLIRPFILRRLKSDVLQELPSKTEITLHVDLSEEEKALYEAYRLKAIQEIDSDQNAAEGRTNNMKVLARITQLRQLSCNIKLVEPESTIASSKLKILNNLLSEILENNHKVLIFSQFVSHLALIKEQLEKNNIHFQYLDGSTPIKQRKVRVDAFQQGQGDVFLISLKAGGTGLNLTAADYVIHMDPWWNPAVEDQASDRVHRIGQQRPVTVYRLVSKETIEEKIILLHKNKRDLAQNLLEGTDKAAKVNMKELMQLMRR